ncbi:hypothetical protein ACOMHN_000847 [Nucella lapillus]
MVQSSGGYGAEFRRIWCRVQEDMVQSSGGYGAEFRRIWCRVQEDMVQSSGGYGAEFRRIWCRVQGDMVQSSGGYGAEFRRIWCRVQEDMVQSSGGYGAEFRRIWCRVQEDMVQSSGGYGAEFRRIWCRVQEDMVQSPGGYGTRQHETLRGIISSKFLLKDIGMLSPDVQTACLESYHAVGNGSLPSVNIMEEAEFITSGRLACPLPDARLKTDPLPDISEVTLEGPGEDSTYNCTFHTTTQASNAGFEVTWLLGGEDEVGTATTLPANETSALISQHDLPLHNGTLTCRVRSFYFEESAFSDYITSNNRTMQD